MNFLRPALRHGKSPCECPPPPPPTPCPVCGHLPCTCPGGPKKKTIKVKLSKLRELTLHTNWDERIQFGDELLSIEEYIQKLFGTLPHFLAGEDDLRQRWSQPDTRQQLLDLLAQSGFPEDKLEMTRRFLEMVLAFSRSLRWKLGKAITGFLFPIFLFLTHTDIYNSTKMYTLREIR